MEWSHAQSLVGIFDGLLRKINERSQVSREKCCRQKQLETRVLWSDTETQCRVDLRENKGGIFVKVH